MPQLDEMVPSVDLLCAIRAAESAGLGTEERLQAIAGYERLLSWLTACQHDLLADAYREFDGDPDLEPQWFGERVGMALGITGPSAYHRMRQAVVLVEKLPHVVSALRNGSITVYHARLAARDARVLDVEVARAVDAAVMADPDWRTPSQLERAFARKVLELDPDGAAARHEGRRRERDVTTRDEPDGMVALWALLSAEHGQAVATKIDAHARSSSATRASDDTRTMAERRADALVELLLRDAAGPEPRMHGRQPDIQVTVAWSTLIGADDAPADLTGFGPIDATTARRIAFDPNSVWRRLLVEPASGRLLEYGRTTYRPPQDLEDFVIARDRFCVFPTCDRPAITCDLDHEHDWIDGGTTCAAKIHALCRRHHRLRHEAGWRYEVNSDDGSTIWTDPVGRRHAKPPAMLPTPQPVEPPDLGPPPF